MNLASRYSAAELWASHHRPSSRWQHAAAHGTVQRLEIELIWDVAAVFLGMSFGIDSSKTLIISALPNRNSCFVWEFYLGDYIEPAIFGRNVLPATSRRHLVATATVLHSRAMPWTFPQEKLRWMQNPPSIGRCGTFGSILGQDRSGIGQGLWLIDSMDQGSWMVGHEVQGRTCDSQKLQLFFLRSTQIWPVV